MNNAEADIHWFCVYTLSYEKPTATTSNVMTINMFSPQLPKSGDTNEISQESANTVVSWEVN